MLAMLHAVAAHHPEREVWWLHGARSGSDHSFAAETRALLGALPNAHSHVCYSRPNAADTEGRDFDGTGRLTAPLLAGLGLPGDSQAYVCGPSAFMDEMSAALAAMGVDASHIHTEPFGPTRVRRRGSPRRPRGRLTRPPSNPAAARPSSLRAATWP